MRTALLAAAAAFLAVTPAIALDQPKSANNLAFDRHTPGFTPIGAKMPNPPLHDVVCVPINYVEKKPDGSQREGVATRCD
jgi:hypothetical protein